MKRWLLALLAGTVLVSTAVASAATLEVQGGTMQVFTFDVDYQVPAPASVTDLGCAFAQGTGTLTWSPVPGAEGYRVYRSPSGKAYTEHSVVTAPVQTISTQLGHLYAVTAFNATGESTLSESVHCPTTDKPGGPAGLAGPGDLGTQSLLSDGNEGLDDDIEDVDPTPTPTPSPTPEEAGDGQADVGTEGAAESVSEASGE